MEIKLDEKYIVGCIYRHPNTNIDHFSSALTQSVCKIREQIPLILGGNLNTDLSRFSHPKIKAYLDTLVELGLLPVITLPIRVTDHTATLIDHIYIRPSKKLLNKLLKPGVLLVN